jgi:methyltransferase family protein
VAGIELSPAMVAQLRTKANAATIPVVLGDMATTIAPGSYTLVYLVYNTISNLLTQAAQVMCFRNAARHLTPGGRFVVELLVPELRKLTPGQQAVVWQSEPAISASTPTMCCANRWYRTISDLVKIGRLGYSALLTATFGLRSWTSWPSGPDSDSRAGRIGLGPPSLRNHVRTSPSTAFRIVSL